MAGGPDSPREPHRQPVSRWSFLSCSRWEGSVNGRGTGSQLSGRRKEALPGPAPPSKELTGGHLHRHRSSSSLSSSRTRCTPHCPRTCCPQRPPRTERLAPSPAPLWPWRSRTRRMGPPTTGRWRNSGAGEGAVGAGLLPGPKPRKQRWTRDAGCVILCSYFPGLVSFKIRGKRKQDAALS